MHMKVLGDLRQGITAVLIGKGHGVFRIAGIAGVAIERFRIGAPLGARNFF